MRAGFVDDVTRERCRGITYLLERVFWPTYSYARAARRAPRRPQLQHVHRPARRLAGRLHARGATCRRLAPLTDARGSLVARVTH